MPEPTKAKKPPEVPNPKKPVKKTTAGKGPVKVFLLVGQSNMQGKGSVKHLDALVASEPKTFGHLKKDGKWVERDDVGIYYFKWTGSGFAKQVIDYGPPREGTGCGIYFAMADLTGNGRSATTQTVPRLVPDDPNPPRRGHTAIG